MTKESGGSVVHCPQHELITSLFGQFYDLADKRREEIAQTVRKENDSFKALSVKAQDNWSWAYAQLSKFGQKTLMDYEAAVNEKQDIEAIELYIQGLKDGAALITFLSEAKEGVQAFLAATRSGGIVQD